MMPRRIIKKRTNNVNPPPAEEEEPYSLMPDFHFIDFVGLDGFDRSTCSWTPVNLSGEDYCSGYEEEVISERGEYKSFQTRLKNPVPVENSYDQKSKKNFVHLPKIPGVKTTEKLGQKKRGQLVYDEKPLGLRNAKDDPDDDELNFQRKLGRIRVFGGERTNCHVQNNGTGRGNAKNSSSCSLPPINNNNVRRSTSLPCGNYSDHMSANKNKFCINQGSSSRYNISNNNRIPWQGPNSKGIYSTHNSAVISYHQRKIGEQGSQIKRCGGGGCITVSKSTLSK